MVCAFEMLACKNQSCPSKPLCTKGVSQMKQHAQHTRNTLLTALVAGVAGVVGEDQQVTREEGAMGAREVHQHAVVARNGDDTQLCDDRSRVRHGERRLSRL